MIGHVRVVIGNGEVVAVLQAVRFNPVGRFRALLRLDSIGDGAAVQMILPGIEDRHTPACRTGAGRCVLDLDVGVIFADRIGCQFFQQVGFRNSISRVHVQHIVPIDRLLDGLVVLFCAHRAPVDLDVEVTSVRRT